MKALYRVTVIVLATIVIFAFTAFGQDFIKPSMKDRCPVCGMKAAMYPKWTAEIVFKDGSYAAFDGPKDMFRFYFNMKKYGSKKTTDDISAIYVTEYYTTQQVKATDPDVYFILGSDVYGPMGVELVPVKGKTQAETFMKDHKGKKMVQFKDVTPSDIPMGMMKMKMKKMKMPMKGC
ncbi:MAG: nitrous oxide reductase accessory protein NosL [Nitrospirae bacterium]|nr:MAG: nitrous oxide reductase accessory protein NosL [Nitrospirota bacterium]